MASEHQNKEYKRDDLRARWSDSDDETNIILNNNNNSNNTPVTPGLIHVIKGYGSNPNSSHGSLEFNNKTEQPSNMPSVMRLDNIVSSLFDMKTHINNQSKIAEFEHLIDLLLLKFNEMQAEKFNLLQQIHKLEKENDKLYTQTNNKSYNSHNCDIDEFKEVVFTAGLETEQSVILVDYFQDNITPKNDKNNCKKSQIKSYIAPWTKYYARHKQGIGEDLRIAIISSQKLQDFATYNDESQYFEETLQNIKIKCYFPKLFTDLRELYDISLPDFVASFRANHLLEINKKCSSLSGSQFFYSFDGKYIIKSMRREEVTFIKQMIYKYCKYIENNQQNSFITKFYAMFKIINTDLMNKLKAQHFVIMNCIYYDSDLFVDIALNIYDIKGSEYNRITEKCNTFQQSTKSNLNANKSISILKDHEWMEKGTKLEIEESEKKNIKKQLFKDIGFLKSLQIMDYSLVVALYNDKNQNKLNAKKYFIGIIDFLQHYDFWKQVEGNGAYYILGIAGYDIVDPEQYANRLWKFITTYIL